eukprot:TRINITY_DN47233_c0_g1_i1.p1 TRINITY_DN47233_c0_g1~~TRINITY_DN47233_c0_g1_i1.p1  ORF type:complete len:632 (+),score=232.32 TRINITY_DN47233_c0_g1_i1:79-1974(+)
MPAAGRREVDLVLLGDAGVGKSAIARRFAGEGFERASGPTVGTECWSTVATLPDGEKVDVNLWDYAGQERFVRLTGDGLRGADGCLLVFDLQVRESFQHVDLWHDEYLQNSVGAREPPLFVLLGNKLDEVEPEVDAEAEEQERMTMDEEALKRREADAVHRRERRQVTPEEATGWCSEERTDAATADEGGRDVPYWETSALRAETIERAVTDAVLRAVRRQVRIADRRSATASGEREVDELAAAVGAGHAAASALRRGSGSGGAESPDAADSGAGSPSHWMGRRASFVDIHAVLLGDACVGKTCFLTQCATGHFEERYNPSQRPLRTLLSYPGLVEEKGAHLTLYDVPGKERGISWDCMRGASVCCIAVAANNRRSLERGLLWREVFMRETGLRCAQSALFILLYTKADLDGPHIDVPSAQARDWAAVHGMEFVMCDSTESEKANATVRELAAIAVRRRIECIAERVEAQLVSAEQASRVSREQLSQRLAQERKQLGDTKCPAPPPQAYADGKVWAGTRKGEDTFVECPVYSFPVKDLQGRATRTDLGGGGGWQTHLPLLLGKVQDLQNDMAKQEQRHKEDMEVLRRANLMETSALRREIEDYRAQLEKEKQRHDDLRWELRLVWQTLESR